MSRLRASTVRPVVRRLAARVGPTLPRRLQEGLLAARSWAAEGIAVGLPAVERVLAIAPHPDDETLAFGGTLALLTDAGATATLVLASDGEATLGSDLPPDEIARRRRAEAGRAAALLGVADVRALGLPDRGLPAQVDGLGATLRDLLAEIRPQLVLLPWFLDASEDHRAVNLALTAAGPAEDVDVWGGEVWAPLPANRVVDISAAVDRKRAALAAHATARGAFDLGALLGLNRYRSIQAHRGEGHAEAFVTAPGPQYAALVARTLALRDGRVAVRT